MRHLRKAHSPRPLPHGLSIQHPSYAYSDSYCQSAWPRLAIHPVPFWHCKRLVRVVCSGHKGLQMLMFCHLWWMWPCLVPTTHWPSDQWWPTRPLDAQGCGHRQGERAKRHMTSHDMLIGNWVQHEDFNGFLLWSRDVSEPQLSRVMKEAVHCATSTGLSQVQGILPDLPGAAAEGLERVCCVTAWQDEMRQIAPAAPWCRSSCGSSTIRRHRVRRRRAWRHRRPCSRSWSRPSDWPEASSVLPKTHVHDLSVQLPWFHKQLTASTGNILKPTGHGIIGPPLNQYKSLPQ